VKSCWTQTKPRHLARQLLLAGGRLAHLEQAPVTGNNGNYRSSLLPSEYRCQQEGRPTTVLSTSKTRRLKPSWQGCLFFQQTYKPSGTDPTALVWGRSVWVKLGVLRKMFFIVDISIRILHDVAVMKRRE